MPSNKIGNWYGIQPYNNKELKNSIENWNYTDKNKEVFITYLINEALNIGLVKETEKNEIREYLIKSSKNLFYATADFIYELSFK